MKTATATIKINADGRCTIPSEARKKLGIDGDDAYVEIDIRYDDD